MSSHAPLAVRSATWLGLPSPQSYKFVKKKLFFSPQLKALSLRNLGSVPVVILRNPVVRYIHLIDVSIPSSDLFDNPDDTESQRGHLQDTQLVYLNIRTSRQRTQNQYRG